MEKEYWYLYCIAPGIPSYAMLCFVLHDQHLVWTPTFLRHSYEWEFGAFVEAIAALIVQQCQQLFKKKKE